MGFFSFFRRKKDKPAEQKATQQPEPVKENRVDKPFEKAQEKRSDFSKGPGKNFKRKPRPKRVNVTDQSKNPNGNNMQATAQRPPKKHYTPRENSKQHFRNYTVKAGDSLSRIAKEFYGNANDWQKIYEANKNRIKDPNVIHPGQTLVIP